MSAPEWHGAFKSAGARGRPQRSLPRALGRALSCLPLLLGLAAGAQAQGTASLTLDPTEIEYHSLDGATITLIPKNASFFAAGTGGGSDDPSTPAGVARHARLLSYVDSRDLVEDGEKIPPTAVRLSAAGLANITLSGAPSGLTIASGRLLARSAGDDHGFPEGTHRSAEITLAYSGSAVAADDPVTVTVNGDVLSRRNAQRESGSGPGNLSADFTVGGPPPAAVTLSPDSLALTELGASSAVEKTYTVVLDSDPVADVTVTVTNGDSTAAEVDTDTGAGGNQDTLTFTAGGTGLGSGAGNGNWRVPQEVTVRALNDADGAGESFNLTHAATAASGPYNGIVIGSVAVTTTDAGHGVVVSESALSVAGDDETVEYTVVLKSRPTGNVVISATSDDTAKATVSPATLTFGVSDWNAPKTFTVTGKGAGSANVSHAVQSSADTTNYPTSTTVSGVAVTVTGARPVVSVDAFGFAFSEGTRDLSFDVTAMPAPAAPLTVRLRVTATGAAASPAPGGVGDVTVTVPTTGSARHNVNIYGDTVDEPDGEVTVEVLAGPGYRVATDPDHIDSLILFDNDAGVMVSPTSLTLEELGAASEVEKTYTIVLDTDPGADVTITATNGDATAVEVDTDSGMSGSQSTLTFTAGGDGSGSGTGNGDWAVARTVTVRALNDADGASESFNITHGATAASGPFNNISIVPVAVATADAGHGVVVSKSSLSVAAGDETATYTVVLKSQPSGNVVISATSGATANAEVDTDADMAGNQNTLTFANSDWNMPQTVTVTGKGQGSTSISHAVSSSADTTNYPTSSTISAVSVTVTPDTRPTVNITGAPFEAWEGESVSVPVALSAARTVDTTVELEQSGLGTATAGADFTAGPWSVTIPAGQTTASASIALTQDTALEMDEAFNVRVRQSTLPAGVAAGTGAARVTIRDDEYSLCFDRNAYAVNEHAGEVDLPLSLSRAVRNDVTVYFDYADRTAVAGADYDEVHASSSDTVTIAAGSRNLTLTVPVHPDLASTANKSFDVTARPSELPDGQTACSTQVIITSTGLVIVETGGDTAVTEDGSDTDTYTIALEDQPDSDVTVTVTAGAGARVNRAGGTAGSTQTLTFGRSGANIWSTAQTVTVTGVDDSVDNPGGVRDVAIGHAASSTDADYTIASAGEVAVRVADDDATAVTLAGAAGDIEEGQSKEFTVTLGRGLVDGEVLTVPLTFGGTATRGADYTMTGATATGVSYANLDSGNASVAFTGPETGATATAATITLSAASDGAAESTAESVVVGLGTITGLAGAGGAAGTDSLADFNIADPPPGAGVTVSTGSLALTELGGAADVEKTYTLVLASDPGADVTVTVTNGDATAVAVDTDADSSGNQDTLIFTHGDSGNWATARTVTVRALNDADGANESFNLTHGAAVSDTGNPYHGIAIDPVAVTTADAGHGVVVSESSLSVAANDETATYTVALKSQPSGNVVISATSGATTTATVSPGTLTFGVSDWNAPKTFTVTGKGAGSTSISHAVQSSADATNYPTSLTISGVSVAVTADSRQVTGSAVLHRDTIVEGQTRAFQISGIPTRPEYYLHASVGGAFTAEAGDVTVTTDNLLGQAQTVTPDSNGPRAYPDRIYNNIRFEVTANPDSDGTGDETFGMRLCTTADCAGGAVLGEWTVTVTEPAADVNVSGATGATVTIVGGGGRLTMMESSANDDPRDRQATLRITLAASPTADIVLVARSLQTVGAGPDAEGNPTRRQTARGVGPNSPDAPEFDVEVARWSSGATGADLTKEAVFYANDNVEDAPGGVHTGNFRFRLLRVDHASYTDGSSGNGAVYAGVTVPDVPFSVIDDDPTRVRILPMPPGLVDNVATEGNSSDTARFRVRIDRALTGPEEVNVPLRFTGATLGTHFTVALDGSPAGATLNTTTGVLTFTTGGREATVVVTAAADDGNTVAESLRVNIPQYSDPWHERHFDTNLAGGACSGVACPNYDKDEGGQRGYVMQLKEAGPGLRLGADVVGEIREGQTETYEVALNTAPAANVTVTVTSSDPTKLRVTQNASITFTPTSWRNRTVHIDAGPNPTDEADPVIAITHAISGTGDYANLPDVVIARTILDDDPTTVSMSGTGVRASPSDTNISKVMLEGDATRVDRSLTVTLSRALAAGEVARIPLILRAEGHSTVDGECDTSGDGAPTSRMAHCAVVEGLRGPRISANVAWPLHHNDFVMTAAGTGVSLEAVNRYTPNYRGYRILEFRGAGARTATFALHARDGFDDGEGFDEEISIGFLDEVEIEGLWTGNFDSGILVETSDDEAWFHIDDDEPPELAEGELVPAEWSLLPSGLTTGDEFRLIYVTSQTTAGSSGDLSTYDTFVRAEITGNDLVNGGVTDMAPYASLFKAVGGKSATAARNHAEFNPGNGEHPDVPIYWVGGNKVADNNGDFTDGNWDDEANPRTADGVMVSPHAAGYWTGSRQDGQTRGGCSGGGGRPSSGTGMGASWVWAGHLDDSTTSPLGPLGFTNGTGDVNHPICAYMYQNSQVRPMYALSGVFVVDAVAGAAIENSSAAEGSAIAFTVTIPNAAPSGGITVPYTIADGRGVSGDPAYLVADSADYTTPNTASVTILQGQTSATFTVATTDDSTYESDHYFTVTLGEPTGTSAPPVDSRNGSAIGIVEDDADLPTVQFDPASVNASEADGAATLTVTRIGATLVPSSVTWTTADGTGASGATHPGDYTSATGTVAFGAAESSKTITVDITADSTAESAETFGVRLSQPVDATLGGDAAATVSVTDAGAASDVLVSWANTDDSALGAAIVISEGTTHTVKVTLGAAPSADVAIPIGVRNVSSGAQAGDYSAPASVTIAGGSTSATFDFAATPDTALENNEAVELTLCPAASCPAGYSSGATPASFQFIIRDVGVVLDLSGLTDAVGVPDKTIAEGGSGTFTVALDTDPVADATLTFKAVAGNAATDVRSLGLAAASPLVAFDGDPDTAGNQNALTFTGGGSGNWQTPQTVTLRALRDGDADSDLYRFGVLNSAASGPYMSQVNTDVPTLLEVTDAVGVVIAPTEVSVAAGETVDYAVSLSSDPGGTVTVTPTSGDTGKATVTGEAVTFTSSNFGTAQQITVTGVGAGAATVTHAVTTGTAAYPTTLTGLPGVDVTVTAAADVDITLSASDGDSDGNAVEGALDATGHRTLTLTLSRALTGAETVTVPLTVQGATVTTDYTFGLLPATQNGVTLVTSGGSNSAQNPAVRFAAGARTATLRFTPVDNGDRTQPAISIGAGTPTASGGVTLGDVTGAPLVFSIVDDETGAVVVPPDWALKPSGLGGGDTFRLIFVTSETRTAESTDIDDYNTWARGVVARGGHASLLPYGGLVTVVGSTTTVDARENTGMWDPALNSNAGGHTDGSASASDSGTKVYWLAAPPSHKVADNYADFYDGSWDGGQDQSSVDRNEAGAQAGGVFQIFTGSDDDGTANRVNNNGPLGAPGVRTGTTSPSNQATNLHRNPGLQFGNRTLEFYGISPVFEVATPELSFDSGGAFSVAEGGTATVTVTSSVAAPAAATVAYTVTDVSATGGADYDAPSGAFALTAGATSHSFTIDTAQDTLVEGNETFTVRLDAGAGYAVGSPDTATVTITDDDTAAATPEISLALQTGEGSSRNTAGQLELNEAGGGDGATFDLSADGVLASALTVCLNVVEAGGDLLAASAEGIKTATLTSGGSANGAGIYALTWTGDGDDERNSVVTATLVAPETAGCSAAAGSYTVASAMSSDAVLIEDDDATTVQLTGADTQMAEGDASDTATLTFTLGRRMHADEVIVVPFTLATTTGARLPGNATPDFTVSASGTGVTIARDNTATPSVTFTGHGTDTVRTATVTLTPVANRDDGDTAREEITATLAPDSVLGSTAGTGATVGGGAMRHATNFAVDLTLSDDEAPPGSVTFSVSGLRLLENGSATYTVRLNQEPTALVTAGISPIGGDRGAVATVSSVHFWPGTGTGASWNSPQTMTVTGVDEPGAHRNRATTIRYSLSSTDPAFSGGTFDLPVAVDDAPEAEAWEGWVRAEGDRGDNATLSRPDTVSSTPGIWPRQDMVFGSRPQDYVIRLSNRPEPGGTVTVVATPGNSDVQLGLTRTGPWQNTLTVTFGDGFAAGAAAPNMAACNNSHDHREGGEAHDGTAATSWECWRKVWVRRVGNGHQCTDITHTASGGGVRARAIETIRIHNPASVRGASACAFLTAASEPMAQNAPAVEVPTARVANLEVAKVDADSASASWDAVEHATGYEVAWDALDGGGQPVASGLATGVAGTSETIAHHAPGAASLEVTVAPQYVDGNGDTRTLPNLAATATLDLGSTGTGDGDSTKDGDTDNGNPEDGGAGNGNPRTGNPPPASCVSDEQWSTVAGYYDSNANRSPNYGANWYRVLIAYRQARPEKALPDWEGATARPTLAYTAKEAEDGETAWSGWTPVREVLECLEKPRTPAPVPDPQPDPPPPPPDPELSLSAGSAVDEGASASFTVHADSAPVADLTVSVTIAQTGDYLDAPGAGTRGITLPAGATTASIDVATVNDNTDEPDGSVSVSLDAGTGYTVASSPNDTASVTVRDNDDPPPPVTVGACVSIPQWKTVEGYYDSNANRSPNYGANWYRVLIAYRQDRGDQELPDWVGATAEPTAAYTAEEAENGEKLWGGWTPVREVLECLERTYGGTSTSSVIGETPNTGPSGEVGTTNPEEAMERDRRNPRDAQRGFEPDAPPDFAAGACVSPQLRSDAVARASETWRGPAHVERWLRVARTFAGGANDATIVTPAEASFHAAAGQPGWMPVADALRCMERQSLQRALLR